MPMQIKTLRIFFTDLLGVHREVVALGRVECSDAVIGVDGSSLYGYARVEKSDVFVAPASSSCIDIGEDGEVFATGVVCLDSRCRDRHPFDPRMVLERAVNYLSTQGYDALVGVELEFYVVKSLAVSVDKASQELRAEPLTMNFDVVKDYAKPLASPADACVVEAATKYLSGVAVQKVHRENGHLGQYEVSLGSKTPVEAGDSILLSINLLRRALRRKGLVAVFLPKPFSHDYGSGLHVHVSLWKDGVNLFASSRDELLYFIGGLLEHSQSLAALTNPSVNSYRRLVEGYEAPVYVSWGVANRTTMIRVPAEGGRVEVRNPDASMSPYFGIAAILLAGLDGLKKKISPGDPIDYNVYVNNRGLKRLPRSLEEALDNLELDNEYLKPAFPAELIETYIELKREEARRARSTPAPMDYALLSHLF